MREPRARPGPGPKGGVGRTPRAVLEEGLCACFGRPVRITSLAGRPLDERSTHPIRRLRVRLDSGEELSVIFKRLRPEAAPKGNRREVLIYRRLLAGRRFGAPLVYASLYDEARGRYWLFLEDVGEETLSHGDQEEWNAAVRWLAHMHAAYHGREEELRALDCLDEHGPPYYREIAETARRHLELAGAWAALARFDSLMARFDELVEYLVRQPRTLVHGDIFPHNILILPGPVVRPIDWEEAGIGLGAWDLARLLDGWGTDKPVFVAAYLAEFARCAAAPLDETAFRRAFGHCGVLNALWHLGWEAEACRDDTYVDGLLNWLEAAWQRLDGRTIGHD